MRDLKKEILNNIIIVDNGCWLWQKCCQSNGYGIIRVKGKNIKTHRLSYSIFKGEIPKGQIIRHICDIKKCCNPDHLILGTQQDNVNDREFRNRGAKGSKSPNTILKEKDIIDILKMHKNGYNGVKISKKYNIHKNSVYNILNGKTWRHVAREGVE